MVWEREQKHRVVHTCIVADKTECERETKQTARQEQGGAWEHAPGIKGGCARVSWQMKTDQALIVAYDVDIHVQPSTWSKSPRSQHNCVAGRIAGRRASMTHQDARHCPAEQMPFWDECLFFGESANRPIDPNQHGAGGLEKKMR